MSESEFETKLGEACESIASCDLIFGKAHLPHRTHVPKRLS